ncbi:outer membrane protein [Pseudaminobacter soli (ex Li et al. 2025)]|uniref:Cell envelope biogenesis protein OmpA n=1 Tax=Pseudaminobacter soli (ex Li et al. 2025) TaxID=1295366 RepID=A0A2P7SIY2_9HYPH|nr:outer membrane protein [Mesorhizobium soli]PSJ62433.1 cell envelope biogenesis protein OmpA [Mesorhizobium soli]
MRKFLTALAALMAGGMSVPAMAADLVEQPVVVAPAIGAWYIRGYLGMTNQRLGELRSDLYNDPTIVAYGWHDKGGFSSSPLFGGGIGYQYNDWVRGDVTLEYRGAADFNALDWVDHGGGNAYTNEFHAKKSEWLFLANGYVDLGEFGPFVPYVGAGIGTSRNTISQFRDVNVMNRGGAWADSDAQWNFAWALHAGLGIKATDRMTIDLGYSFVNLGNARTGPEINYDPVANPGPYDGVQFHRLTSHDLKLGIRYAFN